MSIMGIVVLNHAGDKEYEAELAALRAEHPTKSEEWLAHMMSQYSRWVRTRLEALSSQD